MYTTVFVDIDTQFDFVDPQGSLYVPGAEQCIAQWQVLVQYAQERGIPLLSSVDAHRAQDPEFALFPPHCIVGTAGQKKIGATSVRGAVYVPQQLADPVPLASALVLEKDVFDIFANANLPAILQAWEAEHYVVFGVATDYCVKAAVLGLKERGYRVSLVTDAIQAVTAATGEEALRAMAEAGVRFVTTAEIVGG